jgi:hypothetical protein
VCAISARSSRSSPRVRSVTASASSRSGWRLASTRVSRTQVMCVCVCVCVYVCECIYFYVCIHTLSHTYRHIHTYITHTHTCIHSYIHLCIHTCIQRHTHTHTHTHTHAALHNALAMIYIDTNQSPEKFLQSNTYYDHKVSIYVHITYTHVHTHVHKHTHKHTHTHTHTVGVCCAEILKSTYYTAFTWYCIRALISENFLH